MYSEEPQNLSSIRNELDKILKILSTSSIPLKKQFTHLPLIYLMLLDPAIFNVNYFTHTCLVTGSTEVILLFQRLLRITHKHCFSPGDGAEKKARKIRSCIHEISSEILGATASLNFIFGNAFSFLQLNANVVQTPWEFAGGQAALLGGHVLDTLNKAPPDFHGNKRVSDILGFFRNLIIPIGSVFGLCTALDWSPIALPLPVRQGFTGSTLSMMVLNMVFRGVFYGDRPNEGLFKKIEVVFQNVSELEKTMLGFMFLAMSKAFYAQNKTHPMVTIFGTAALACVSNLASVTRNVAGLVSDITTKTIWSTNSISRAFHIVESSLLAVAHGIIGVDAVRGTEFISPTVYAPILAGSQAMGAIGDVFSNKSTKEKAMNITPKLLATAILIWYSMSSSDQYGLGMMIFFMFYIIDWIFQATEPAAKPVSSEKKPLLGQVNDGDTTV